MRVRRRRTWNGVAVAAIPVLASLTFSATWATVVRQDTLSIEGIRLDVKKKPPGASSGRFRFESAALRRRSIVEVLVGRGAEWRSTHTDRRDAPTSRLIAHEGVCGIRRGRLYCRRAPRYPGSAISPIR